MHTRPNPSLQPNRSTTRVAPAILALLVTCTILLGCSDETRPVVELPDTDTADDLDEKDTAQDTELPEPDQDQQDPEFPDQDQQEQDQQTPDEQSDLEELDEELDNELDTPDQEEDLPNSKCGNGKLEAGEECDDGNDSNLDFCLDDCRFSCGDGVVQAHEKCDLGITEGEGSCPTSCTSSNACEPLSLIGNACLAECVGSTISSCKHGDGCCPEGCTQVNDQDCPSLCDNGIIELGESCDPISSCPSSCPAQHACLSANLRGSAALCTAQCQYDEITLCSHADGCCPEGCTPLQDDDCDFVCGDGQLDAGESCDPPSSCPVSCDDGDACTQDLMSGNAAACTLRCAHLPISVCADGDGCCPTACSVATDNDCDPVCGNGALEGNEECDDGNLLDGDGCSALCQLEKVAFRPYDIDLRDPHIFVDIPLLGCRDFTDNAAPFGIAPSMNDLIAQSLTGDSGGSGYLDLSILLLFRPLTLDEGASAQVEVGGGACTAPVQSTVCGPHPNVPFEPSIYTNSTPASPICLSPIPNTTGAYSPAVTTPSQLCFSTAEATLELDLGGIVIPLNNAQIAASYLGDPALALRDGLILGFISEADADATILPPKLPLIGGQPLSSLLPGGASACAPHDDRDVGPDGFTLGWWFYLNFAAQRVTYIGP